MSIRKDTNLPNVWNIEVKVSIPAYNTQRQWYRNRSRETSIAAFNEYVDDMFSAGRRDHSVRRMGGFSASNENG